MALIQYFLFVQIFSSSIRIGFTRKATAFSQRNFFLIQKNNSWIFFVFFSCTINSYYYCPYYRSIQLYKTKWSSVRKMFLLTRQTSYFLSFSCWLSNLPFYLTFILPIVLYIFVNSIIFSIVTYTILCRKHDRQLHSTQTIESQRLSRFLLACSCFIVLCLTWIFALFTIGSIRIIFQILFCIFASLTGFLIFILYIITSKTKRILWNSKLNGFHIWLFK